jgi:hypothetical protein
VNRILVMNNYEPNFCLYWHHRLRRTLVLQEMIHQEKVLAEIPEFAEHFPCFLLFPRANFIDTNNNPLIVAQIPPYIFLHRFE